MGEQVYFWHINPFTPARNLAKYQSKVLVLYGPSVGIKHIAKGFFNIFIRSSKN